MILRLDIYPEKQYNLNISEQKIRGVGYFLLKMIR